MTIDFSKKRTWLNLSEAQSNDVVQPTTLVQNSCSRTFLKDMVHMTYGKGRKSFPRICCGFFRYSKIDMMCRKKIVWCESHLKSRLKCWVEINRTVSIINVWLNRVSNNLWFHRWKNGLDEFLRRCSIWQNRCFKPPYLPIWAFLQNIFVSLERKRDWKWGNPKHHQFLIAM